MSKNTLSINSHWKVKLAELPLQSRLCWEHSLRRYSTMRVGGTAACFIDVLNCEDLSQLLPFIQQYQIPYFVLGKGSNLIIPDTGWPGIILRLSSNFEDWHIFEEDHLVCVGAALPDVIFAKRSVPLGWSGVEFLIGIPGSIGGAIAMNAGAHGTEISDHLKTVWWMDMDGNQHQGDRDSLEFSYRSSPLNAVSGSIITSALFQLKESDSQTVKSHMKQFQSYRETTQPTKIPNCGSVFKNPPGHYAAKLIESAGLKGYGIGNAQISEKHSNFIVNQGNAKAADVIALIELAQDTVWKVHQISLEPEVQLLTHAQC
ncbi:MAG: UDP-N-acetylmuramate dehydrogenase [SAR324 cluster bacterium]|nr:UDP-N-acetylmuramate dehydrogenase [SAR324 cluster bacterium]